MDREAGLLLRPHFIEKGDIIHLLQLIRGTFVGQNRASIVDGYHINVFSAATVWVGAVSVLTGDADSGLATLGCSQVAPGHTEAPVVLGAVEVLHLLTGHVDHHLPNLQP